MKLEGRYLLEEDFVGGRGPFLMVHIVSLLRPSGGGLEEGLQETGLGNREEN
jgi:hypothetical protein